MNHQTKIVIVLAMTFNLSLVAYAANYDLKEITPEVQQALDSRKARYGDLQRFKSEGTVGEDNQGFTKLLKDSPEADSAVQAENENRQVIYQAIVDQNNLGPGGMSDVRSVFAEVQRGKARPGDFIQERSGDWTQK